MRRRIAAVYLLTLMGIWVLPAVVLATVWSMSIGNFVVYHDEERFEAVFGWLWLSPVNRIAAWGWNPEADQADRLRLWERDQLASMMPRR